MTKFEPSFSSQLIVTDVTYKTVKDNYYLCSSVIYVLRLKKRLVIFEAVIGGRERFLQSTLKYPFSTLVYPVLRNGL